VTLLERVAQRRVYLDANVFIYGVEGTPPYFDLVAPVIRAVVEGGQDAVTSEITLAECLVGPFRHRDERTERAFYDVLRPRGGLTVAPVTREVLVGAARLRAARRALKLPDAVHAATARLYSCSVFLTNDTHVRAVPGLEVVLLSAVVEG
jgi:predicted nucleic acid-binding protein